MTIEKNKVVHIHYTLKNGEGTTLDSSEGREPLAYIQGIGNIIPGLERALEGKKEGDKVDAVIEPKEAYGEKSDGNIQVVPKRGFQGSEQLQVGMQVQVEMEKGPAIASVSKIEGENVTLDFNHPLAGMTLHFNVEVVTIRDASAEELEHGHVHGPGGHHH